VRRAGPRARSYRDLRGETGLHTAREGIDYLACRAAAAPGERARRGRLWRACRVARHAIERRQAFGPARRRCRACLRASSRARQRRDGSDRCSRSSETAGTSPQSDAPGDGHTDERQPAKGRTVASPFGPEARRVLPERSVSSPAAESLHVVRRDGEARRPGPVDEVPPARLCRKAVTHEARTGSSATARAAPARTLRGEIERISRSARAREHVTCRSTVGLPASSYGVNQPAC
jgi:hypothetical protein